jgi:hypothetical protein
MSTQAWREAHQEQMRAYRRKHYRLHKEPYIARAKSQRAALRAWFRVLKKTKRCERCPEWFWACLEFHHIDPKHKVFNLSRAIAAGWSRKRILEEIAKCMVLCANCHRREHHPA